ncbi:MAG: sugar ABC transporter permease [Candidatus Omnitrophica bacterium]|jgi:ABC-type sugar transport system permease subunit|nr:sugar ABC transporter permease [Candidatus Omnitrophota bacterium]MDD5080078.1 sugar ABC transporter permease [Candidatus Omnitrophota bacterium]MDD5775735.1 sugar ABC transporter permease [Candidatus Omnitrophota bacterium]
MKVKATLENYLFVLPAVAIFSVFYVIPFIWVFQLGMYEWNGISVSRVFVGLSNFKEILFGDPVWWQAMRQVGYITLFALTFQNALAFMLAMACDREIRLKNFYRVLFFIPPVLSEVVVGLVWKYIILNSDGLVNHGIATVGLTNFFNSWLSLPNQPFTGNWTSHTNTALTCVAIVHSWKGFGWGFLIFLAGLQGIPRELYEAAKVDGANSWDCFRKITLPLMVPVIVLVAILTILGTMQSFVLIISLIGGELAGHTTVPVLRILASMRGSSRFGYACAQGISFGVILVMISFIQYKFSQKFKQA